MAYSTELSCTACNNENTTKVCESNGYDLISCDNCRLVFAPQAIHESPVDYDGLYVEDGLYANKLMAVPNRSSRDFPRAIRKGLREISSLRPATLLEIGSGNGDFLSLIEEMGVECAGVESSRNAVEIARKRLEGPVEHGLFSSGMFADRTFDVICTWEVLEHVHDLQGFVSCIFDRLRPGGYLFMCTPNYESRWMWNDLSNDPRSAPPVHVTFWNRNTLQRFLDSVFEENLVQSFSVPQNAARRSGKTLAEVRVVADSIFRPSQRKTLYSRSRKPA